MIEGVRPTGEEAGTRREYKGSAHKMTVLFATTGHILDAAVTGRRAEDQMIPCASLGYKLPRMQA